MRITKELSCIVCPMSCHLQVEMDGDTIIKVSGNTCIRGEQYAKSEMTCPMRLVTTTVKINGAASPLLPVITSTQVPKTKIFAIMEACKTLVVEAPIEIDAVICKNIAKSGADLIASRSMERAMKYEPTASSSH